jgi:hypothetical protein
MNLPRLPRHSQLRVAQAIGACVGALTIGLSGAPAALAAPAWLPPTDVSRPGVIASPPHVAVDAAGDAVAIWSRRDDAGENVIEAASRPAGGSWSTTALSAPGAGAFEPQIAVNAAGDAVAVWVGTAGGIETASRPAGGSWSAQMTRLSGPAGFAIEPQIALSASGDAVAVWTQVEGVNRIIEAAVRPAGAGWSTPATKISPPSRLAERPQVGIDAAGEAVAIWSSDGAGTRTMVETASRPAGAGWSTQATELSDPAFDGGQPQVAVNPAGEAVAIWRVIRPGNRLSLEVASRPAGGAWSQQLTGASGSNPQIAIDPSGNAVAVWAGSGPNGEGNVIEAASRTPSRSWSAQTTKLSAPSPAADQPEVAIDAAGDAVAIWRRFENTKTIETASRRLGGDWSAPTKLSVPEPSNPEFPQVSLDAAGDALAIWKRNPDTNSVIRTAAYDAAPPQLRSLAIPATATAGAPLSFSVAPFDAFSSQVGIEWSFGDGTGSVAGAMASHTYGAPGTYKVTVTATDEAPNSAAATATITVEPGHPKAVAARTGRLRSAKALVRLSCPITGPCQGTAKLTVRHGAKRRLMLGQRRFRIAAGESIVLAIKLSAAGKRLLAAAPRRGLTARVSGNGVAASTVRLRR